MNKETFICEGITSSYEIILKEGSRRLVDSKHEFANFFKLNVRKQIKCYVSVISQFWNWEDVALRLHHCYLN